MKLKGTVVGAFACVSGRRYLSRYGSLEKAWEKAEDHNKSWVFFRFLTRKERDTLVNQGKSLWDLDDPKVFQKMERRMLKKVGYHIGFNNAAVNNASLIKYPKKGRATRTPLDRLR